MNNPIALGANTLRQVGEQINAAIQGVATQGAVGTSGLLRAIASGAPRLPGLPAIAGNGNGANGNGGLPALPGIAQAALLLRPLVQLEQAVLPRGVPGPASVLMSATRTPVPAPVTPAGTTAPITGPTTTTPGVEGINGHGSRRAAGVQLS